MDGNFNGIYYSFIPGNKVGLSLNLTSNLINQKLRNLWNLCYYHTIMFPIFKPYDPVQLKSQAFLKSL